MRTVLVLFILVVGTTIKAQSFLPANFIDYKQGNQLTYRNNLKDSARDKKWFLNTYSGIATSFSFFKGGNATVIAAPVGLQLSRKLNNNLYAFAAISAAPAYTSFNRSFLSSNGIKSGQNSHTFQSNSFDMFSRAELGLMYVNDQKTFSISGSIGIERSSYPVMPYNQINNARPYPVTAPN